MMNVKVDKEMCKSCDKCFVMLYDPTGLFKGGKAVEYFADGKSIPKEGYLICTGNMNDRVDDMPYCPKKQKLAKIEEAKKHKYRLKKEVCSECICKYAAERKDLKCYGHFKGFWNGWQPHEIETAFADWWAEGEIMCPFDDDWTQTNDEYICLQNRSEHMTRHPAHDACPYKDKHSNSDDDAYMAEIAAKDDFPGIKKAQCKKCFALHGNTWNDPGWKKYFRRDDDILWDEGYLNCMKMYFESDMIRLQEARDKVCPFLDDPDGEKMRKSGEEAAERRAKRDKEFNEMIARIKADQPN